MINLHCRETDAIKFAAWGITREPGHVGSVFVGELSKMPTADEMAKLAQAEVPFWIGQTVGDVTFSWISDGATVVPSLPKGSVEDNLPYRLAYDHLDALLYPTEELR